jgi:hypothetical protein
LQSGLARSTGSSGHLGFWLSLFFLKPGPIPAPGWPAGPDRV